MVGQSVCTTVMCSDGRRKVSEMWNTFNYLAGNNSSFDTAHFLPACNTIQQSLDAIDSWYATWIPFNPVCCSIDDIGNQAVQLTNDMLSSVGAAGVPIPPPPPGSDWMKTAVVIGVIAIAVVYSPQIKKAFA